MDVLPESLTAVRERRRSVFPRRSSCEMRSVARRTGRRCVPEAGRCVQHLDRRSVLREFRLRDSGSGARRDRRRCVLWSRRPHLHGDASDRRERADQGAGTRAAGSDRFAMLDRRTFRHPPGRHDWRGQHGRRRKRGDQRCPPERSRSGQSLSRRSDASVGRGGEQQAQPGHVPGRRKAALGRARLRRGASGVPTASPCFRNSSAPRGRSHSPAEVRCPRRRATRCRCARAAGGCEPPARRTRFRRCPR